MKGWVKHVIIVPLYALSGRSLLQSSAYRWLSAFRRLCDTPPGGETESSQSNPNSFFFFPFKQTSLCLIEIWKDIRFQNHLFCKHLLLQISIKMWLPVFQAKVENAQPQEVSPEPASRLQSLRDRDTVTRFDRAVSILPQLSAMIVPI